LVRETAAELMALQALIVRLDADRFYTYSWTPDAVPS
jgi:hypothetical protein